MLVPWRFSILVKNNVEIAKNIRKYDFDVSSYYPNLTSRFKNHRKENYKNAELIENSILNFWISNNYNKSKIKKINTLIKN